jgi:hypothetical protein
MRMPKTASIVDRVSQHSAASTIAAHVVRSSMPGVHHSYLRDHLDSLERFGSVSRAKRSFLVAMMTIRPCIRKMAQSHCEHLTHVDPRQNTCTFQGQSMKLLAVYQALEKS